MNKTILDVIRETFATLLLSPNIAMTSMFQSHIITVTNIGNGEYSVVVIKGNVMVDHKLITFKMENLNVLP